MKPCIGSKCMSFQLTTTADFMSTKIYLDLTCLQEGLSMQASPQTSCVSSSNIIYQLQQIRSKSHNCHPFSVFTLADYDRGKPPGACLFRAIGVLVLKHGESAHLPKKDVEEWASLENGRIKAILLDIIQLYPTNSDIPILKNDTLNKHLSSFADLLVPSIVAANESVAIQIAQVFDFVV